MSARSPAPQVSPLPEAFGLVRDWLDNGPEAGGTPPYTEADEVAQLFGLDAFGRNILLLCAYASLEPEAQEQLSTLLGAEGVQAPTVGVALARLPGAHWQALSADGPLRKSRLTALEGAGAIASRRIALAEPVLFRLLDAPGLGPLASTYLRPIPAGGTMAPNRARLTERIAARMDLPGAPVLHLVGPDPDGKLQAFNRAVGGAYAMNLQSLPATTGEIMELSEELSRDMTLTAARLALVHVSTEDDRPAQLFAECYPGPLAIVSTEPLQVGRRRALRLEMPIMTAAEQRPVLETALGDLNQRLNGAVSSIAATFRMPPETADAIAAELTTVPPTPDLKEGEEDPALASAAWEACRRAARPRMDDLAQRVDSAPDWDDLILPPRQKDLLAGIAAQVRNRAQVYEEWDFAQRLQNKGLGVSALFSGPSGAGKSMAGEVLGAALDLDVYRVDLSALVSKWVGETEKNLRRVFDAAEDGGVILQFDEADALFGRRSEVKDSHDRHANIEVSYLLQRLEAYRGLCILTTNMRDNIDEAFLRRIRFSVEFRFPNRSERLAIWRRMFPKAVPLNGIDYDRLAQFKVPGGSIRNIALGATFLAADKGGAVSMDDLLVAARQEYDKLGRNMTDAEQAGWPR